MLVQTISNKTGTVEPRNKEVGYNKTLFNNKVILLVPALYIFTLMI